MTDVGLGVGRGGRGDERGGGRGKGGGWKGERGGYSWYFHQDPRHNELFFFSQKKSVLSLSSF